MAKNGSAAVSIFPEAVLSSIPDIKIVYNTVPYF